MPTYHFVAEVLPKHEVIAKFKGGGDFSKLIYRFSPDPKMTIAGIQETYAVTDHTGGFRLDKVHIGELRNQISHAELHHDQTERARADLWMFDAGLASKRIEELRKWNDPNYRDALRKDYKSQKGQHVVHRLKQLKISDAGLESKIKEIEERHDQLLNEGEPNFISQRISAICKFIYTVLDTVRSKTKDCESHQGKKQKNKPKQIECLEIIKDTGKIYYLLNPVLSYVNSRVDFERAVNYWQEVDSWADL